MFFGCNRKLLAVLLATTLLATSNVYAQEGNTVITTGPVSMVHGSSRVQPQDGQAGFGVGFN